MATYTYDISSIAVIPVLDGLDNVVYQVDWFVEAEDGTFRARYANSSVVGNPDPNDFIPYEDLTEAIIKSWISDPLTAELMAYLDDLILKQVIESRAEYRPLPWVSGQ